jgi:hypothetical protein
MLGKLVVVAAAALAVLSQPRGAGVISGLVVDDQGDPVRKAVVTLTWRGTPMSWATVLTDASGRFSF